MAENQSPPVRLFYNGVRFVCPCGNNDFRAEVGMEPVRFWCVCGAMYTEQIVNDLGQESKELAVSDG